MTQREELKQVLSIRDILKGDDRKETEFTRRRQLVLNEAELFQTPEEFNKVDSS